MKRELIALAAAGVAVAGCSSSGLSPREAAGRTQSAYLYSLYDNLAPAQPDGPARPLRLPASVAVVQVGEVAPPQPMIDALRKEPGVFSRIDSLPGTDPYTVAPQDGYRYYSPAPAPAAPARPELSTLRRLAADTGSEYLLLVGGTIDHDNNGTPLSLLDLTIVGAFAVPSRETWGTAKASAALIDVRSGRVVVNSSAEARRRSFVPAASVAGEEVKLLEKLRDDVVAKLGAQVLADAKSRAAFGNAAPVSYPADGKPVDGARYETAWR